MINQKEIQIEDVHLAISQNKKLLLKNLGNFSATMHDVETLKKKGRNSKLANAGDDLINQDDDIMNNNMVQESNAQNDMDLLVIDVPVTNQTTTQPVNDTDLIGMDIDFGVTPTQPVKQEIKTR
jgi:hypothetical protein